MTRTTNFKGAPLELLGKEIKVGDTAPSFTVTGADLKDIPSSSFFGKPLILSLIPSIDTSVCAIETKRFSDEMKKLGDAVECLTVSMDLPFAQKRWCAAEGVSNIKLASDFKYREVGTAFGAVIKDWGTTSRAVFVIDPQGKIAHAQYVPEISHEPNYNAVIDAAKNATA